MALPIGAAAEKLRVVLFKAHGERRLRGQERWNPGQQWRRPAVTCRGTRPRAASLIPPRPMATGIPQARHPWVSAPIGQVLTAGKYPDSRAKWAAASGGGSRVA